VLLSPACDTRRITGLSCSVFWQRTVQCDILVYSRDFLCSFCLKSYNSYW
jgi:hypothetical protein